MNEQDEHWNEIRRRVDKDRANMAFLRELADRVNYPITTRAANVLTEMGIDTEEKLLKLNVYELLGVPNLGNKSVRHIAELQRLLSRDVDLRDHLLHGLKDISALVKDAPADNDLARKVRTKVNKVLGDYKNHSKR